MDLLFFQDDRYARGALEIPSEAPAFSAGFSLFETIRIDRAGRGFRVGDHADRLARSAGAFGMTGAPGAEKIKEVAAALSGENILEWGRLRITLGAAGENSSTLLIQAMPWTPLSRDRRARGLDGVIMPFKRHRASPLSGHKTGNHLEALLSRKNLAPDAEGILLNDAERVCEGLYSNVFAVRGGSVETPALSEGCLPGVTRLAVMELASSMGLTVTEVEMAPADMESADGAFVTNALGGVTPLASFDGRAFKTPPPGEILLLMDALDAAAGR